MYLSFELAKRISEYRSAYLNVNSKSKKKKKLDPKLNIYLFAYMLNEKPL